MSRSHGREIVDRRLDVEESREPPRIWSVLRTSHQVLTHGSERGVGLPTLFARAGRGGRVVHGQIGLYKFFMKDL